MNEASQVLRYTTTGPIDSEEETASNRDGRAVKVLSWVILMICLAVWAVVGAAFWIPLVLRRILTYSAVLVPSMLSDRKPREAALKLRSATSFYWRGFKVTAEMITRDPAREERAAPSRNEEAPRPMALAGELAWTLLVWYAVLFSVGVIQATPVDAWQWLVALPWRERVADPVMEWVRTHRP